MKTQGRSCEGKFRYARRADANAELEQLRGRTFRRRTGNRKQRANIYECSFCGGYHIGHTAARNGFYRRTQSERNVTTIITGDRGEGE